MDHHGGYGDGRDAVRRRGGAGSPADGGRGDGAARRRPGHRHLGHRRQQAGAHLRGGKGPVINYGERGGGGYKMGKLQVPKLVVPPPPPSTQDRLKHFAPSLLKGGILFCAPLWYGYNFKLLC